MGSRFLSLSCLRMMIQAMQRSKRSVTLFPLQWLGATRSWRSMEGRLGAECTHGALWKVCPLRTSFTGDGVRCRFVCCASRGPPLPLCSLRVSLWVCVSVVENKRHSDFLLLRDMLIRTHMQDLKDFTQDIHYENFRKRKLTRGGSPYLS